MSLFTFKNLRPRPRRTEKTLCSLFPSTFWFQILFNFSFSLPRADRQALGSREKRRMGGTKSNSKKLCERRRRSQEILLEKQ